MRLQHGKDTQEVTDMQDIPETKTANEHPQTVQSVEPTSTSLPALMPRVVIVGAGFGGLNAAKALGDAPVQVTVIDRNKHGIATLGITTGRNLLLDSNRLPRRPAFDARFCWPLRWQKRSRTLRNAGPS